MNAIQYEVVTHVVGNNIERRSSCCLLCLFTAPKKKQNRDSELGLSSLHRTEIVNQTDYQFSCSIRLHPY